MFLLAFCSLSQKYMATLSEAGFGSGDLLDKKLEY